MSTKASGNASASKECAKNVGQRTEMTSAVTPDASLLSDRSVLKMTGEAEGFLHRLVTNSVLKIAPGEARYAGLLSPQGKLLFDFLIVPLPEGAAAGYYLDCAKDQADDLAKRLTFHKMRAKITIENVSDKQGIAAFWSALPPEIAEGTLYKDPRASAMGFRLIAPHDLLARIAAKNETAYEAHRIALGVPKGGVDFAYGDAFPHDANLDALHGVDFDKGCYVGQEIVARVHFRKTARKRIVKVHFAGPVPKSGNPVLFGDIAIGEIGSIAGQDGLASLRLDRYEDAKAAGVPLKAGAATLDVDVPEDFVAAAAGAEKRL
jgi:tRNA-modifying protein YgfZ